MPDNQVDLVIKTTAQGTGAQQAAEGLDKVTASAKATVPATAKLIEETDQATISKGKWAAAVNKLTHEIPVLGYAVAAIKNPIAIASLAIVGLVQAFRKLGDEIQEVQRSNNAWDVVLNSVRDLGSFSRESKEQARQFAEQLHAVGTGADAAAKGLAKINDEIQRRNRLAAEQENADLAEAVAGVDLRESRQEISGSQASGLRASIRKKYAKLAAERAASALHEQGEQAQAAASGLHWKASQAEKSLPGMRAGLDKAQTRQQEITAENQLLLGDAPGSFNKELADVDKEIAQQEAYQQGSFGGWGWKDAVYPLLGKKAGEDLGRKQLAAPQALIELRRRKERIFQQRKAAAERQREIDRDVDRRKKQISTTEGFAPTGQQQAQELFEKGKGQIDQAAQQRAADARRLETEGRTLDLGTEADYTRELIEKAKQNRQDQDRLDRGAGRGFLGAGIGGAQPIVAAIESNTAGLQSAFASIERALKDQGRTIETADARFRSFHGSSIG